MFKFLKSPTFDWIVITLVGSAVAFFIINQVSSKVEYGEAIVFKHTSIAPHTTTQQTGHLFANTTTYKHSASCKINLVFKGEEFYTIVYRDCSTVFDENKRGTVTYLGGRWFHSIKIIDMKV